MVTSRMILPTWLIHSVSERRNRQQLIASQMAWMHCSLELWRRWDLPRKKLAGTGTSRSICSSRHTVPRISSIHRTQEAPLAGGPRQRDLVPVLRSILRISEAGLLVVAFTPLGERPTSTCTIQTSAQVASLGTSESTDLSATWLIFFIQTLTQHTVHGHHQKVVREGNLEVVAALPLCIKAGQKKCCYAI
jgi:hypothetical protein